jgi:hypothetical protein
MNWKDLSMAFKIIVSVLFILSLLAVSSMVYNWYSDRFKPPTSQTSYINQPEIKKAKDIGHKKIVVLSKIDVLDKDEATEKLKLNDPIKSDKTKQITATAEIAPYDGKTDVISVLDTEKGTSEIIAKQVPLSFMGFENKKEFYIEGGLNTKGNVEIGGGLQWQFARIASARVGLAGEVRGSQDNTTGFIGIRGTYTFK